MGSLADIYAPACYFAETLASIASQPYRRPRLGPWHFDIDPCRGDQRHPIQALYSKPHRRIWRKFGVMPNYFASAYISSAG